MLEIVEKIAWYAEQAGLKLVDDKPRFDSEGQRLWLCQDETGAVEPYTEMAIIGSALWRRGVFA